nr:hypothetical protein [Prevotella sp.]
MKPIEVACAFKACCYGLHGLSAARKRFVSMRSHTAKCSSAAGETSDGPPTL